MYFPKFILKKFHGERNMIKITQSYNPCNLNLVLWNGRKCCCVQEAFEMMIELFHRQQVPTLGAVFVVIFQGGWVL